MTQQTVFVVEYACGHIHERDLSVKDPDPREPYVRYLRTQECPDCWHKRQQAHMDEWEAQARLRPLTGSPEQIAFARDVRQKLLRDAFTQLDQAVYDSDIEPPARRIVKAGWWLDHRTDSPAAFQRALARDAAHGNQDA